MSALFDFPSLIVVLLLFISTTAYLRSLYPTIFDSYKQSSNDNLDPSIAIDNKDKHIGFYGFCWKASRIGERLSPYISVSFIVMTFYILFVK